MKIPGLVDLQVNGYQGVDFSNSDLTEGDFAQACWGILEMNYLVLMPVKKLSRIFYFWMIVRYYLYKLLSC